MNEATPRLPAKHREGLDAGTADGAGVSGDAPELARLLEEYLQALEAGQRPDRQALLAAHPQWAPRLEEALAGLDFIHSVGRQPQGAPAQLGDFRVVREVGRGGMGVVYEAEQVSLKRRVALKVLRVGGVADETAMQRFQREAETVARLHHTNIVPIFAVGGEAGVRYYAMQFIQGRDLAALSAEARQNARPLAVEAVAGWGLQAAEALAHAHRAGVIHRDIKPSNLILDEGGRLWLTDFGLARRVDDVTLSLTGALLGTPRYMSPEQARAAAERIDHRTDLYSLGATLYELATGRPLFEAATPQDIIHRILHEEPAAPRDLAPGIPRDLETIILKCLAKDPAARYDGAQPLADDLRALLEGRPIRARRPSVLERSVRWARKHRRTTTVAGWSVAASIAALCGLVVGLRSYQRAQLGWVQLTAAEPRLQAAVWSATEDRLVQPAVSLPTPQALALPAGEYTVRVAAPDRLSEKLRLEVRRGERLSYELAAATPHRLQPFTLALHDTTELARLDGPEDFLVARRGLVRRLDAITGAELWQTDLRRPAANLADSGLEQAWASMLDRRPQTSGPRLVRPAPDLDGDRVGDAVWSAEAVPVLLAVSGRDGRFLWWHPGSPPDASAETAAREPYQVSWGTVAGTPAVIEIDGDATPDLVALFASGQRKWVEAVSGRTGATLWRRGLDPAWFVKPAWAGRELLFAPRVCVVEGRPVLVVTANTQLVLLAPATGEMIWRESLAQPVLVEPQLGDLDGDGENDVLLLGERGAHFTALTAISPSRRRILWATPLTAIGASQLDESGRLSWPLLVDLDHDRRLEIIVPANSPAATAAESAAADQGHGLEARRGADGAMLWSRTLGYARSPLGVPQVQQLIVGPDLDQDGSDELLCASLHRLSSAAEDTALYLDAVSGATGRGVWWSRTEVAAQSTVGPLAWWQIGADGWPQLVVPVGQWPRRPTRVLIFGGGSGALEHTLPEASAPRCADADGDGLPELFFQVPAPERTAAFDTQQRSLPGAAPIVWSRLATATGSEAAVPDLDGDGTDEVLLGNPLALCSGATGRQLWRAAAETRAVFPLSGAAGDLDRDGRTDGVAWLASPAADRTGGLHPLVAWSGRDGHVLWTSDLQVRSLTSLRLVTGAPSTHLSALVLVAGEMDLPTAGAAESSAAPNRLWLVALSAQDGRVRWRQPLSPARADALGEWRWAPAVGNFASNGVPAIVACGLTASNTWRLLACRIDDGHVLWERAFSGSPDAPGAVLYANRPQPVLADLDADGRLEVLVIDYALQPGTAAGGGEVRGELLALGAADGALRWSWSWAEGAVQSPQAPLLFSASDGRSRTVCVLIGQSREPELVQLDARGQMLARRRIGPVKAPAQLWTHESVGGGDPRVWVLNAHDQLEAWSLDLGQVLWRRPAAEVLGWWKGTAEAGEPTLLMRDGATLWGVSPSSGEPWWRCAWTARTGTAPALLRCSLPGGAPGVVQAGRCRAALPVDAAGTVRESRGPGAQPGPPRADPRQAGRSPSASRGST